VSTIAVAYSCVLRRSLGFCRYPVSLEHSHRLVVRRQMINSHGLFESLSKKAPGKKVLGISAILDSPDWS